MQKITPFLLFDGNAEEAFEYYCGIFKDAERGKVERYGPNGPMPEGTVLTASFTLFGTKFILLNGPKADFTMAVSFHISCTTQQQVDHYWDNLTANGGEESMCGWLKDKYGLYWQVVPEQMEQLMTQGSPEQSQRVMQAMMQMKKLDIATLEAAYKG